MRAHTYTDSSTYCTSTVVLLHHQTQSVSYDLSVDRPAVIGCLEDYMNGNNTSVVEGTENAFLVSGARHEVFISWNRSRSLLSSSSLEYTPVMEDIGGALLWMVCHLEN